MVKYYGRARQRIGSVNTNQLGLKMSGCPSRVGRKGTIDRYISQRVSCLRGICGGSLVNGVLWNNNALRNNRPFCAPPVEKCLAAAGGIGNINTPYYKTNAPGTKGCGIGVTGFHPRGSTPGAIVQRGVNGEILSVRVPRPLPTILRLGYTCSGGHALAYDDKTPAVQAGTECGIGLFNSGPITGYSAFLEGGNGVPGLGLKLNTVMIAPPWCDGRFLPDGFYGCDSPPPGWEPPAQDKNKQYINFLFESNLPKDQIKNLFENPWNPAPPFAFTITCKGLTEGHPVTFTGIPSTAVVVDNSQYIGVPKPWGKYCVVTKAIPISGMTKPPGKDVNDLKPYLGANAFTITFHPVM